MRIGSLFSGYGGLEQAVQAVLGGAVAWHAEIDPAPSRILAHRFPGVPNLGDITAVDWSAVEPVDVLTGGFPCQDVSHAGKRAGLRPDTRSGLWTHMAYAIEQLRPRLVVVENVRGLLGAAAHSDVEPCPWCVGDGSAGGLRALGAVLGDLADLGFDAEWVGVRAADAGAPHGRFRVFVVAWPAEDPDGSTGGERRLAAPGQAEGGRPRADAGRRGGASAADASSAERRGPEPEHLGAGPVPAAEPRERAGTDWGPYAAAIHRWEHTLGRVAPAPTEPGRNGGPRLSPAFVEWLMGLPAGWVTDPAIGLSRNEQLKALGNGVVPQQAALALRMILGGDAEPVPAEGAVLPTPTVVDMGAGKTPDEWDEWTGAMKGKHGNGNGHGRSLEQEALGLGGDA